MPVYRSQRMFLKNGITDNKQWSVAEQHRTSSGFLEALT